MPEGTPGEGTQVPQGDATPTTPPVENPEAGKDVTPGENPPNANDPKPDTSKFVPYERFKEVNDELKGLKTKFEGISPQLETVEKLRSAFNPQDEGIDYSQFESPEQFMDYVSKNFEKKWADREKALEDKILSSVNARYRLESLKSEHPELKEDKEFRDIVVTQMALHPDKDPQEIVESVKKYLSAVEERAKKKHEEEFLNKGTYSGRSGNNQPYESDDADDIRKGIVGAGKHGGIF